MAEQGRQGFDGDNGDFGAEGQDMGPPADDFAQEPEMPEPAPAPAPVYASPEPSPIASRANELKAIAPMTESAKLIQHVLAQPPTRRVGKIMLKEAMRGLLPNEILNRKDKRGFPVPFVEWAQGPLRDFIGERIGYVPDPEKPWDRKWWNDMLAGQAALV